MEIEGPIENLFAEWPNLKEIQLSNNRLTGKVPVTLNERNPLLEVIDLSDNDLTGEIPTTIGNLPELKLLRLHENNLRGSISASLGNLKKLGKFRYIDSYLCARIFHLLLHTNLHRDSCAGKECPER